MEFYLFILVCCAVLCSAANYKQEFAGKVALVTGGTSGIGFQTSLELAQYGAKVIIVARDSHPTWFNGAGAVEKINSDPDVIAAGGSARFFKADMSEGKEVKALFDDIRKNENTLDFAINCAGIVSPMEDFIDSGSYIMGPHDPIRNNVYSGIYSLMYETRFMIEKNISGSIVHIASVDGIMTTDGGGLYTTSKFGVIGLVRSVAAGVAAPSDGAPAIRVNSIAPGLVDTSLTWQQVKEDAYGKQDWEDPYITKDSDAWKVFGPQWVDELVSKCMASPKNIADTILYLLSSDASYVTGSVLVVGRGDTA